jgi:hypothetical protein
VLLLLQGDYSTNVQKRQEKKVEQMTTDNNTYHHLERPVPTPVEQEKYGSKGMGQR